MTVTGPLRRSPCAGLHVALGARTVTTAGWEHVTDYGDVPSERKFLHETVGVADITARAKIDVRGSIPTTLQITGDSLLAWIAENWVVVFDQPGVEEILVPQLKASAGPVAMVSDVTHAYAGFALVGPSTSAVISRLTPWDADGLRHGRSTAAQIGHVRAIALRHAVASVLELYVETPFARYFFETLLGVVRRAGGGPVGWRALQEEGWR